MRIETQNQCKDDLITRLTLEYKKKSVIEDWQELYSARTDYMTFVPSPDGTKVAITPSGNNLTVIIDRKKVKEDVKGIVAKGDGLVYSDEDKGEFEYPYKTYVVIAKKK